jgi:hypothetical protein
MNCVSGAVLPSPQPRGVYVAKEINPVCLEEASCNTEHVHPTLVWGPSGVPVMFPCRKADWVPYWINKFVMDNNVHRSHKKFMLTHLKPSGHYIYHQCNIHEFNRLPHTMYLCVLCGSQNKQRLFPYTALTDWFFNREKVFLLCGTDWVFKYNSGSS